MKKVRISNDRKSEEVVMNRDYVAEFTYPSLGIKKGDDMKLFYINNKYFYSFTPIEYYVKPYAPKEIYEVLVKKNSVLEDLKNEFDLIFTV